MKKLFTNLKVALTLLLLCGVCSAWGKDVTLQFENIGSSLGSTSNTTVSTINITPKDGNSAYTFNYLQGKKQGDAILLAKSTGAFISNKTPMPGNIKSITVHINSGASGKTTYHCAFSTTECTEAYTTGSTAVNITGGNSNKYTCSVSNARYFCVSLGNANNGQILSLSIEYEESTNPKYEITTAANPANAGEVIANPTTQEAEQQVTLTASPNEAYNFTSWSITKTTDGGDTGITVTDDGKFTMPAYAVTATANFTEKEKYSVTYYVNGTQETVNNVYAGTIISSKLPVPSSEVSGYVFKGWVASPIEGAVQTAPSYYDIAQGIGGNITLYAVFALETKENVAFSKYEKVTTAPVDWSGRYLLSTGEKTFSGQKGTNNYGGYEDIVPGTTEQTQYEVEVAKTTNGYSIYHDGKYLGQTSNDNNLNFSSTFKSIDYEWKFDTSEGAGHGVISVRNDAYALKYNSSSPRMSCYTSAQTHVYMYKRIETGAIIYSDYCTAINVEAGDVAFEIGEGATFLKNSVFTAAKTSVRPGTYTELPTATRPLYTFLGWYLNTDVDQEIVSSITVADGDDLTYVAKWQDLSLSNIEDVTETGDYKVQGTVVGTTSGGFVVGDATGFAYVYTGSFDHGKTIGDKITVIGSVSEYAGILEFKDNLEISEAASSTYDVSVQPTAIDASALVNLISSKQPQFIEYVGVLSYSGTYYNIAVKGTTDAYGRIYSPSTEQITALGELLGEESSVEVKVRGYYVGVGNNKYANTILGTIEAYTIPTHTLTVNVEGEGCDVDVQINSVKQDGVNGVYTIKDGESVKLVKKPATHYTFAEWSSEDIEITDDAKTTSPLEFIVTKDITVNASFEENEYNTITWSVNGETDVIPASKVYVDEAIQFPTTVEDINDKKFVGWVGESNKDYSNATTAPTFATSATATVDATYYAVFASASEGEPETRTSTLTIETSTVPETPWTDKNTGVVWSYNKVNFKNDDAAGMPNGSTISFSLPTNATATKLTITRTGNQWSTSNISIALSGTSKTFNDAGFYTFTDADNKCGTYTLTATNQSSKVAYIANIQIEFSAQSVIYSNYCTTITSADVTVSSAGWATACLPFDATVEGATAYYVIGTNENALEMKEANVIPAGKGVLLKSNDGGAATVTFTASTATADDVTGNMMKGSLTDTEFDEDGYTYYILTLGDDDKVGFYWDWETEDEGASAKCPAGKAILAVPANGGSAKKFFYLDDDATGINSVEMSKKNNGIRYNLNGQAVGNDFKGVVIVNGKKFVK